MHNVSDAEVALKQCLAAILDVRLTGTFLKNSDADSVELTSKINQPEEPNICYITVNFITIFTLLHQAVIQSDLSLWINKFTTPENGFLSSASFEHCIVVLKLLAGSPQTERRQLIECLILLQAFYTANERTCILPFRAFYIKQLSEQLDIKREFMLWAREVKGNPQVCTTNFENWSLIEFPFCLEPERKALILRVENNIRMRHELQDAFFRALFAGIQCPYLMLEVRREWIIPDTLAQLEAKTGYDLKKQLKVRFIGEEAIDEGGVQKEFFQLVMRELFDKKYGMFSSYCTKKSTTNLPNQCDQAYYYSWFPFIREPEEALLGEYALVGKLLGLAIYNSVILDVSFPKCLYRKLLGLDVGLEDLKDLDPLMHRSLSQLLACKEEEFESFGIETFSCMLEGIDESKHWIELKEQGGQLPLQWSDRHEWVSLYVDMLLSRSISQQFASFKKGFDSLCSDTALSTLFRPEEVEELICGCPCLSFDELEQVAQYENGFHPQHPYIKDFWSIVHEMSDEDKRKLLAFTTGSDRIPVGGLSKLTFVISKNGPDSDRLPTAHTCFNILLLCEYCDKEKLRRMLTIAIQNYEGFGLI